MRKTIIKNCQEHGETEFAVNPTRPSGRCKKCDSTAVTKRRRKMKGKAVEYKGSKCSECGITGPNCIFDFHHLEPEKKNFGIGRKGHCRSWEQVKKELDQCILVCANCHRIIESKIYERDFS